MLIGGLEEGSTSGLRAEISFSITFLYPLAWLSGLLVVFSQWAVSLAASELSRRAVQASTYEPTVVSPGLFPIRSPFWY